MRDLHCSWKGRAKPAWRIWSSLSRSWYVDILVWLNTIFSYFYIFAWLIVKIGLYSKCRKLTNAKYCCWDRVRSARPVYSGDLPAILMIRYRPLLELSTSRRSWLWGADRWRFSCGTLLEQRGIELYRLFTTEIWMEFCWFLISRMPLLSEDWSIGFKSLVKRGRKLWWCWWETKTTRKTGDRSPKQMHWKRLNNSKFHIMRPIFMMKHPWTRYSSTCCRK